MFDVVMEWIERLVWTVYEAFGDPVFAWAKQTEFFVSGGLLALLAIGLIVCYFRLVPSSVISGLMISLGIFGTFYGILTALEPLDFSPEKMNDSVTALLDGMKTAFASSLLGLGSAISFRVVFSIFVEPLAQLLRSKKAESPVHKDMNERLDAIKQAIADGNLSLVAQVEKLQGESREIKQAIVGDDDVSLAAQVVKLQGESQEIKQAIAGDDDSSLAAQMQKLRQENEEGFKKLDGLSKIIEEALVANLNKLIDELRDILTKQLKEQMDKLINDINEALIEKFGTTFVQFNEGVQALKKWQEDHRVQVEQLTRAFDETAQGIAKIKENCDAIPGTMGQLEEIVKVVNHQINELNARLEAFANMRQQAEQSFPVIKENLDKIGQDLQNSAQGFHQMENAINSIAEKMQQQVTNTNALIQRSFAEISQEFDTQMRGMASNMQSSVEQSQRDVNNRVQEAISNMSQQITQEMDRIAQEWGQNMVAIAEKCADVIRDNQGIR